MVLSQETPSFRNAMLWAACCLGFFGFLRAGEFTCTSTGNGTQGVISVADVSIDSRENPQLLTVHLRTSKTDPFSVGAYLYLGRTSTILCPVAAVLGYLAIRPSNPGPLFILEDGTPLKKEYFVAHLREALSRAGVQTAGFSGHSFRIGAASAAAKAGMNDSFIQTLGRWRSDAFTTYIRTPAAELAAATIRLATA